MHNAKRPPMEQSAAYMAAFDHFNARLFAGELPRPMLTFSRQHPRFRGYFAAERWRGEDGAPVHEIALNANALATATLDELMVTLVHEMGHLAQEANPEKYGKPGRDGYHTAEWRKVMEECGLTCHGKGQTVHTTPPEDGTGPFWEAYGSLPLDALLPYEALLLDMPESGGGGGGGGEEEGEEQGEEQEPQPQPAPKKIKKGSRVKYVCPACGAAAWGGRGLSLHCGCQPSKMPMVPASDED